MVMGYQYCGDDNVRAHLWLWVINMVEMQMLGLTCGDNDLHNGCGYQIGGNCYQLKVNHFKAFFCLPFLHWHLPSNGMK